MSVPAVERHEFLNVPGDLTPNLALSAWAGVGAKDSVLTARDLFRP